MVSETSQVEGHRGGSLILLLRSSLLALISPSLYPSHPIMRLRSSPMSPYSVMATRVFGMQVTPGGARLVVGLVVRKVVLL